jgi:hypothetical protein
MSVEDRFWAKVDKSAGPDGCWLWTASTSYGYGRISIGARPGRRVAAHRVSWQLVNGPMSAGMQVDHKCFNRVCVNPAHLRIATNKQNNEHRQGARRDSKSGIRGVYFDKCRNRWHATVRNHGKNVHVGRFTTKAEAAEAARLKRLELFTHNDLDQRSTK